MRELISFKKLVDLAWSLPAGATRIFYVSAPDYNEEDGLCMFGMASLELFAGSSMVVISLYEGGLPIAINTTSDDSCLKSELEDYFRDIGADPKTLCI